MNDMPMTAATLFSGIGAPEVAMPGWRWPWHAEIEKFPSAVMAARHPNSINLGDVSAHDFTERAAEIAHPDIIVFGSPCQSYSVAGKRLGLDDPRGNLALVALGIVDRLKPGWFVFENVPGLLSSSEGRDFGIFLRTVDELGYRGGWASLDAQWFGVAQRRERLFFVGHSGDWRYPAAVLFEPEGLLGNHPPRRETGKAVAPTIASRPTGGGGLGTDFDCDDGLIAGYGGNRTSGPVEVATALQAHAGPAGRMDFASETFIAMPIHSDAGRRNSSALTPSPDAEGHVRLRDPGIGVGEPGDPMYTLSATQPHAVAFSCKDYGADMQEGIAPTMRAMGHSGSHANAGGQLAVAFNWQGGGEQTTLGYDPKSGITGALHVGQTPAAVIRSGVRRLTPRECERLQGFPDDYTLIEYRKKPAADGPRYKALGNSMAVPVLRWILSRIELAPNENKTP